VGGLLVKVPCTASGWPMCRGLGAKGVPLPAVLAAWGLASSRIDTGVPSSSAAPSSRMGEGGRSSSSMSSGVGGWV
jgi:hypothetical protein